MLFSVTNHSEWLSYILKVNGDLPIAYSMIQALKDNEAKSQMNCSLNKIYQVLKDNVLNRCQSSDGKSRMLLGVR